VRRDVLGRNPESEQERLVIGIAITSLEWQRDQLERISKLKACLSR